MPAPRHVALPVGQGRVLGRVPSAPAEKILHVHPWGDVTGRQEDSELRQCMDCLVREKRCAL